MPDFTLLVLPGSYASSVAATLDMLRAAASLAPRLRLAPPTWRVLSPDGGPVDLGSGLWVDSTPLPQRLRRDPGTWVLPGLGTEDVETLMAALQQPQAQRLIQALSTHAALEGRIAASCSAVFMLQAAGLLAGRQVTTSWWLAPQLQQLEPRCRVDADRMICTDGPLCTAGAAFAQVDLMLHLFRQQFGVPLAEAVSRVLLINGREAQAPFMVPALLASGDALVGQLLRRIEAGLPQIPSVAALAQQLGLSTRTLSRRVHQATGKSTLALIHSVRLQRARLLIESSTLSIEEVAAQVGYEDATALRRLMRKLQGQAPSQLRKRSSLV
ncbi:GlxA family transcriptional regulator [Roseateles sp.]|uniref:GlxA family transcriptional regulator n=1 Tax=Roseateles sp. TaxID=1971397 RepID=UPI003BA7BFAF